MTAPRARVPLRHRVEFAGFVLFRGLLRLLPLRASLGLGAALGWLAGSVLRVRRTVVDQNLLRAFPRESPAWRSRVAAASYRHLGRESVMTFLLAGASSERIREMTQVEGLEELEEALARGKGVVMATGHLGNWELGAAALAARGIGVDAVVQVQRNRHFDAELRRAREGLGVTVMSKQSAPRGVLSSLRRGRLAALVADQNVLRAGVFVEFFGFPAATAKGPAIFALRTGAPLWAGAALRVPGRGGRYRVVMQPVRADLTGLSLIHI